jgi:acetyl-CoA synthase
MTREMKEYLGPLLRERAAEIGMPDLVDRIADETVAVTPAALVEHLVRVGHPALKLPSLL